MPILKLKDTEAIGADALEQALRLQRTVLESSFFGELPIFEVTSEENSFVDEGTKKVMVSKITLKSEGSLTNAGVVSISAQIDNLNILTHKTMIVAPDEDNDPNTFNYNPYTSDIFSYYNLRNEEYEDFTINFNERTLPNFCLGALWSRQEFTPEQIEQYTMYNTIPSLTGSDMLAGLPDTNINNFEFDDEFLEYDALQSPQYETQKDYFKTLLAVSPQDNIRYAAANSNVFVDFTYSSFDSNQIGNVPFFNKIRLVGRDIIQSDDPNTQRDETDRYRSTVVKAFRDCLMTDKLIKSFRHAESSIRSFRIGQQDVDVKIYGLLEAFESIGYGERMAAPDELILRSTEQGYVVDDNSPFTFYFYKLLLLGKLRRLQFSYAKTFRQLIIEGQDHRNEQIGFKVVKRRQGRDTPVQTFYFLNRAGLDDFVDTQIKFNVVYEYQIFGLFAIFGSNYTYENVEQELDPTSGLFSIKFDFINRPSIQVAEVLLSTKNTRVIEPPPITPEITFYNEMTSKNKVKIRLEHQDGNIVDEYSQKPLRSFMNNQGYINKLKQYFGGSDKVLVTSGKTSGGIYEIYRLEEPPTSYADFEDALLATVQSSQVYSNGETAKSLMYTDLIKHEKKYYYTFRVLTHRRNPSELSPIYVVEMYEDADETFLTFDLYEIPEIQKEQNNYSMRKFIQIKPNFVQTSANQSQLIDEYPSADAALDGFGLGLDTLDEKLWEYNNKDKYIKLRLESKNSGRKMDLNLYFKIKKQTD